MASLVAPLFEAHDPLGLAGIKAIPRGLTLVRAAAWAAPRTAPTVFSTLSPDVPSAVWDRSPLRREVVVRSGLRRWAEQSQVRCWRVLAKAQATHVAALPPPVVDITPFAREQEEAWARSLRPHLLELELRALIYAGSIKQRGQGDGVALTSATSLFVSEHRRALVMQTQFAHAAIDPANVLVAANELVVIADLGVHRFGAIREMFAWVRRRTRATWFLGAIDVVRSRSDEARWVLEPEQEEDLERDPDPGDEHRPSRRDQVDRARPRSTRAGPTGDDQDDRDEAHT